MKTAKCELKNSIGITFFLLLILSLSGCGGGGGSSQVIEVPPSNPTGIKVVISGSNELTISWNSVANTASYNVYWSTSLGASKQSTKISGITTTSYAHTGRTIGTTYYYVVTAVNSYGESSASAEVFALLDTPRPPGAVAAVAGDGQATLSWSTTGAISYNVYMASQSGVTKTNYLSLADGMAHVGVTSPFNHTGLVNGTPYYFVVTSINSFGESSESNEVSVTPAASSSLTVSGSVKYEDKEYGTSGFTVNTSYKAVRFAEVQAVDSTIGTTIVTGTTDASGLYTLTLPSTSKIYIRVISSALSPSIGVKDLSNALHAAAGSNFTASGTAMANISVPATNPAAGAFNILDVYTSGAQFVQSLSGSYPPALTAFWQTGNANGTYYCSYDPFFCAGGEGIYILNSNGDTDEYDDDVLWHEYGHFIAAKYSKDDSPGGAHSISTNDLDLRLSWSEGWGDFFPPSVKTWLNATTPSLLSTVPAMATSVYVDTSTSGGALQSFDFGNPVCTPSPCIYASNEAAVAKALIGIRNFYGMQAVWNVISSITPATTTVPVNLEIFWDRWNLLFPASDITAYLAERAIAYSADSYEADNAANPLRKAAVNGLAENHTLYGSGDVDYVAFDTVAGQQYTARTTAIKNGADTVISIIAPDQVTVVTSNDNTSGMNYTNSVPNNCDIMWGECHENGFDILGSTASFTAAATGTYYVEVKSSPNRPLSAGKYGGYSLTITSP